MKIGTMSIIVGNMYCNARCPFCISKVTMPCGVDLIKTKNQVNDVNWRNFDKCCNLAIKSGVTTAFLTSKGEPTLYPDLITTYLHKLNDYGFPIIDLQTNAILMEDGAFDDYLELWYKMGLTTICISTVHWDDEANAKIYQPHIQGKHRNLQVIIKKLRKIGFTVRLTCMLLKGYIDRFTLVGYLAEYCKINGVKQLTIRPLNTMNDVDNEFSQAVHDLSISEKDSDLIQKTLMSCGNKVLTLPHGDTVFDLNGQNICFGSCLTDSKDTDNIRQIIFYPDGTVRWDWKYEGSILF